MNAYPTNDYLSYLEHHGIKGQKWGIRNADWYPIAAFKAAGGKVKSAVSNTKAAHTAKKRKKQQLANLQKAREAKVKKAQEEKDFTEEKKRILTSGTPGEVVKIAGKLTNQEIQDAMLRNANLEKLRAAEKTRINDIKEAEFNKKFEKVDKIAKVADKVGGYAKTGVNLYTNVKTLMDAVSGNKDKEKKPVISNIEDVLKNPKKYSDDQVRAAKERKANLDAMKDKEKEPEKKAKTSPSVDDILNNPGKYSDDDIRDAWQRQQNLNNMRNDKESRTTYKQTVEDAPKYNNHNDNDQRSDFKSRVVDGDWSEVITPQNVSTAIAIANRAMNAYDSAKASKAASKSVSNGTKLLESKNYAQLLLDVNDDDDRRRK